MARARSRPALAILPVFLTLTLALGGCGGGATRSGPTTANQTVANDVLFRAIGLVGTPYRHGGNTPEGGFDCSGLVGYVYREAAGLGLPRTTQGLSEHAASRVDRKRLRPGDLVFFGKRRASHVGIYVGEGRFVHAPSSGGTVRMDALDGPYWRENYLQARRILQ